MKTAVDKKYEMFGCYKDTAMAIDDVESKYFIPEDIWKGEFKPYYSGAAYIMTGEVALQLAEIKEKVQEKCHEY